MDPNIKKRSVAKGIPALIPGVVIIIGILHYIYLNPWVFGDLAVLAFIGVLIIVAAAAMVFAVTAILAIPLYVFKGEQYQEGRSYKLEDVKEVTGTSERKEEK
jgi:hypothetical protein